MWTIFCLCLTCLVPPLCTVFKINIAILGIVSMLQEIIPTLHIHTKACRGFCPLQITEKTKFWGYHRMQLLTMNASIFVCCKHCGDLITKHLVLLLFSLFMYVYQYVLNVCESNGKTKTSQLVFLGFFFVFLLTNVLTGEKSRKNVQPVSSQKAPYTKLSQSRYRIYSSPLVWLTPSLHWY